MKCNKCNKWAGAHATLPGQSTEHLCMCPPQRTWVGLTDEEKSEMWDRAEKRQAYQGVPALAALIQEVEAKLKEKNT